MCVRLEGEQAEAALLRNPNKCPSSGRWTTLTNDTRQASLSGCQFASACVSISPSPILSLPLPVCLTVCLSGSFANSNFKFVGNLQLHFCPEWNSEQPAGINMPARQTALQAACGPCGESYPPGSGLAGLPADPAAVAAFSQ